jgi:hypothetical protein
MIRNKPRNAAVFGVDIGKNIFHVVGMDASGEIVTRQVPTRYCTSLLSASSSADRAAGRSQ